MWRDEEDYLIDWSDDAEKIKRFVDAVGSPYRGAATFLAKKLVRIADVQIEADVLIDGRSKAVGKVIFMRQQHPVIVCGAGLIRITEIRAESGENLLEKIPFRSRFNSNGHV
jgi:methionyl-tRNA formyltransferase